MRGVDFLVELPHGDAGTFTTMRIMARMAARPAATVRAKAAELTAGQSPPAAIARLFLFVRDQVANVPDPRGIEWLQAPHVTLENPIGDCDDKAALLAALLVAAGFRVRFVAIGVRSRALTVVLIEVWRPGGWLALDPKNPHAWPGWSYPWPSRVERLAIGEL